MKYKTKNIKKIIYHIVGVASKIFIAVCKYFIVKIDSSLIFFYFIFCVNPVYPISFYFVLIIFHMNLHQWVFFSGFLRVGNAIPTIEVHFEHLSVEAEAQVGSRALPTFLNFYVNIMEVITLK